MAFAFPKPPAEGADPKAPPVLPADVFCCCPNVVPEIADAPNGEAAPEVPASLRKRPLGAVKPVDGFAAPKSPVFVVEELPRFPKSEPPPVPLGAELPPGPLCPRLPSW